MGDFDKKSCSVMPNLVVRYSPKYISGVVTPRRRRDVVLSYILAKAPRCERGSRKLTRSLHDKNQPPGLITPICPRLSATCDSFAAAKYPDPTTATTPEESRAPA